MKPIIKDVLKNVKFEGEDWRSWILRPFLYHADIFLSDFSGNIKEASTHPIFIDCDRSEYDKEGDLSCVVYDEEEYKRVRKIITDCTDDESFRQGLFLSYILYTKYSDVDNNDLAYYIKRGERFAAAERPRAECERNHEKWEKICVKFDARKAAANRLIKEPERDEDTPLDEEWIRKNTINPIYDITIKWHGGKTVYEFDSHKLNFALSEMQGTYYENPHREFYMTLLNSTAYMELESGELFDTMKQIVLFALDVDKFSTPGAYLGSFGETGQAINKKVARALFPLYAYIRRHKSKLYTPHDSAGVAIHLLDLTVPEEEKLRYYIGKGVSESAKVSLEWKQRY